MIETIIVPLDGSELAESALPLAHELQRKLQARLVLVRAIEPPGSSLATAPGVLEPPAGVAAEIDLAQKIGYEERRIAQAYLEALAGRLGAGPIETVIVEDSAADAIVRLAKARAGAMVVMSSHGRGGLGRLVFGSVADAVLRRSPAPVTLVRHGA